MLVALHIFKFCVEAINQLFQLFDMRFSLLLMDRIVGGGEQANGGDFTASTASPMSARHCVIVIVIKDQALAVTTRLNGTFSEAGRGIRYLAEKLEIATHLCLQLAALLLCAQCSRSTDIDALKTAAAFPGIDIGGIQATGSGGVFLHGVKEGTCLDDGKALEHFDYPVEIPFQADVIDFQTGKGFGNDFTESFRVLARQFPVSLANGFSQGKDLPRHLCPVLFGDIQFADGRQQQIVDIMNGVGNGSIRADNRALHAAGTQVGGILRHIEPEQALVLPGGARYWYEQAATGHHRGFADAAILDAIGQSFVVIGVVEQAVCHRTAGGPGHGGRDFDAGSAVHGHELFSLLVFPGTVINPDRGLQSFSHHSHVAVDHRCTLGTELFCHLLLDLFQNGIFRSVCSNPIHMSANRTDEGDAHHADFQIRYGGMLFGNAEGIHDIKLDSLFPYGLARKGRQFPPHFEGRVMGLHDQCAILDESTQWIGVAEHFMVGGDDDLDVLQFRISDLDGFWTEGDIEVGRGTALL